MKNIKTKTSLALMLAGILTVAGGLKLALYNTKKEIEFKQNFPARVYEIEDELSRIKRLSSKDILDKIIDPNSPKFVEDYKSLVKELDTYDPNMIADALNSQQKYKNYFVLNGLGIATGIGCSYLGLGCLIISHLDSRRKRKKKEEPITQSD